MADSTTRHWSKVSERRRSWLKWLTVAFLLYLLLVGFFIVPAMREKLLRGILSLN